MLEGIRQQPGEDDEAFLMRAERVTDMEEKAIRERARHLVALAVRVSDKPETVVGGQDTLRKMLNHPRPYITRRALLLARSLCREMQDASTGSDPVAQEAYWLLSQLALTALAPQASSPDTAPAA